KLNEDLQIRPVVLLDKTHYPLTLLIMPSNKDLFFRIVYDCCRFEASVISNLMNYFQALLESVVTHPEQRLSTVPLLTAQERHLLLEDWNATRAVAAPEMSLSQLVEARVAQTPETIALVE